jgi:putative membrane protein
LSADHFVSYDLARGLHIIAVIAWIAGMLMLPRFYASITALPAGEALEQALLLQARRIRTIILTPFMVLAWAFGIFLFFSYFAPDWEAPSERLEYVPHWFWLKLALALTLTLYHALLTGEGRRLARGERRRSELFWRVMSVVPFFIAAAIVLLATVEP